MVDETAKPTLRSRVTKFARDLFTEKDGTTFDFVRVFGAGGIFWWIGQYSYAVIEKIQMFDPLNAAYGLAALVLSVATGVAARSFSKSEAGDGK